ncbi:hypothetical protein QOZ80_1BG0097730 [Eleusine coracana subsp. coracana]|nr:hypothetical protein QOZ80_1BG0097730 [Eleusine coracana subsp. coracana]
MVMEPSLLAKPSVSVFFLSTTSTRGRGKSRVAAAGHGKDLDPTSRLDRGNNNGQQVALPSSSKVLGSSTRRRKARLVTAVTCCLLHQPLLVPSMAAALEEAAAAKLEFVLGELDPATAKTVAGVAGPSLSALGFLFILRIVMSWYPRLPVTKFPYVLAYAPTEPFLAVTRKLIPPLGGVDVTPVVWFGLVSFLNEILVGPQGLLVLLSQQQLS